MLVEIDCFMIWTMLLRFTTGLHNSVCTLVDNLTKSAFHCVKT